jgi:hypothetical protein
MEALLSESIGAMSEAQKNKFFFRRTKGMSVETQVNLAKECLSETDRTIRRNNGAQRVEESGDFSMEKADEILFEGLRKARPQAWTEVKESPEASGLTGDQRKDYEFCRLLGMSEADSLRSVKADIRD